MNVQDTQLSAAELERILNRMDEAYIAVIGDLCLDVYWEADMRLSELSRETPHHPLPIVAERYSPGGAGNAACNVAALKPKRLAVVGLAGTDWRGDLLAEALAERGVDGSGIIREPGRVTNTYIKPLRKGLSDVVYEDPRLDFENREPIHTECEERVLSELEAAATEADVLCVCDQVRYGCITPHIRNRLCSLGKAGKTIIVDSRDRVAEYRHVTIKPNEVEAARAFGESTSKEPESMAALAARIQERNGRLTLMTLGAMGSLVAEKNGVTLVPACAVEPPIDFCGAGDTFLAGFAMAMAAGASPIQSAQVATLCAAVTIRKIGVTGTASREEIVAAWKCYCQ